MMAAAASFNTGDAAVDASLAEWMSMDKNEATRQQLLDLVAAKDLATLRKVMLQRMEFGTAGLRAAMGAGNARMNDLTIIQSAQGLCKAIEDAIPNAKEMGVVFGYDHRKNQYGCSETFAKLSAAVFLSRGFKVYMFGRMTCTPFVPFAVRRYQTAAGVMVTASHNPKDDNGYKVYWSNGAQIIPPYDKMIATAIEANLKPWFDTWAALDTVDSKVVNAYEDCMEAYMEATLKSSRMGHITKSRPIPIVYTAMHGVGKPFVERIFADYGIKPFLPCKEQVEADPTFPTVKFPNPEEGKSALNLSIALAEKEGSRYILANDPDADRLAVAQKLDDGRWHVFKGNEIGTLFAWWMWESHVAKHPDVPASKCAMVASTVSSKFIKAMAAAEGFRFEETLTGFKWMANKGIELEQNEGLKVLMAYEEAIGFMLGTTVWDKDGVHAAAVMAEMMHYLDEKGSSLTGQLNALYLKYGYFTTNDSYFLCYDPKIMEAIFNRIRPNYPTKLGRFPLKAVRDMTVGYDSNYADLKPRLPLTPDAQMITFYFENGAVVTVRGSGTEPKLKYYSEMTGKITCEEDKDKVAAELQEVVNAIISDFLHPQENGLVARAD
eukprot:comp23982_c0_seq1/m.42575 comp23982_c0_seq1/g.42575  ORF comp23982_c0_seq1/g.42575 comp23982_c0_seq1/m.42575 type:complete len:606 (-) comp23982_c0_seq1:310-2127(-)